MISAILFIFGITLIYTGVLASERDLTTGLAVACMGLILIFKPALYAARYCLNHFGGGLNQRGRSVSTKIKTREVHLKVVKSKEDKPTIH